MKLLRILLLTLVLIGCGSDPKGYLPQVSELRAIGKLDLVEYQTEEVFMISANEVRLADIHSIEEVNDYLASLLRAGDRIGIYSFTIYSVAYIDLTLFSPEEDADYDKHNKHVTITLPPVQIEPMGRSGDLKKLHERVTGLQRSITPEERRQIQNKAVAYAKGRLAPDTEQYSELISLAEAKGTAYFTGLLKARGCKEVTVKFKTK